MSRSRPRDANLRAVGHLKHELIRIAVIGDVSDATPISSGRALLALRPLRALSPLRSLWAFRTDTVHEQGPCSMLHANHVAGGRIQVAVAFFPHISPGVRAAMQRIHFATTAALDI